MMFDKPTIALQQMKSFRKNPLFSPQLKKQSTSKHIELPVEEPRKKEPDKAPLPIPQATKPSEPTTQTFGSLSHLLQNIDPSIEILQKDHEIYRKKIAILLEGTPLQKKLLEALKKNFLLTITFCESIEEILDADLILASSKYKQHSATQYTGFYLTTIKQIPTVFLLEDHQYENMEYKRALWNHLKQNLS